MPTSKQRRDAARRHLERQLQRRVERDAARKRFTLIASIIGTLVLIAVVVVVVVAVGNDHSSKSTAGGTTLPTDTPSITSTPSPTSTYPAATGATVNFEGVTVKGAADLKGYPAVTSAATGEPPKLLIKDLVVGKGKAANEKSGVTVQYTGVLYKEGTQFDSSWTRGQPATFTLGPGKVIDGFTQGIGGTTGVPPMKVGGRRIIIMPSKLGYGAQSPGAEIPPNSPLVFIVDLLAVT